ncbi:hypothetical protein GN956_G23811 [Arapaima gigas]
MSGPNGDPNISLEDDVDEDEFNEEEYAAINSMLDQISSCLDDLEERNDALNGKLHELLESNRQTRKEFREQLSGTPPGEQESPGAPDASPSDREQAEK